MGNDRIPRMKLEWSAEGTRRKGKPSVQRMHRVARSMINKDLREEDAEDGELWRNKIAFYEGYLLYSRISTIKVIATICSELHGGKF